MATIDLNANMDANMDATTKIIPKLLRTISESELYIDLESSLLDFHNNFTPYIKSMKKVFIKKGVMMSKFDYINSLYDSNNYIGINIIVDMLYREYSSIPFYSQRYTKYEELIHFCEFLLLFFNNTIRYHVIREEGCKLIHNLNMGHELGIKIAKRVSKMLKL